MYKFILCFFCAFFALAASAQVRLSWINRTEAPADYNAVVFRGESVVLEAALTQYGIALPLDGTATLYYAVAGTTNFTASAASISGNKLLALWTPELDSGAARYTFFLSAAMSGGRIYRANGSITMQSSPGAYPPIIPQTGPTLVSLQDAVTAAGNTNAAQQVAIGALQTGQSSLTGQVNAALAMSFAAGDQATLARNTANAAALTAGVVRTTGTYLAATQAVHTATLAGHGSALSVLSGATTSNYVIATGALARANEALARPVGTDTGTVSSIVSAIAQTNLPAFLYNGPRTNMTFEGQTLKFWSSVVLSNRVSVVYVANYTITNGVDVVVVPEGTSFVLENGSIEHYVDLSDGSIGYNPDAYNLFASYDLDHITLQILAPTTSATVDRIDIGVSSGLPRIVDDAVWLDFIRTGFEKNYNLENFQLKGTASTLLINGNLYEQYWDTNANTTAWRQL